MFFDANLNFLCENPKEKVKLYESSVFLINQVLNFIYFF